MMNQKEINTKAMADIFAIDESREMFEAIGMLNDDSALDQQDPLGDDPFDPSQLMDVTTAPQSDPFGSPTIAAPQEPSDEDKRFVVDRFGEMLAEKSKETVEFSDAAVFGPLIQDEIGGRMNVTQFLEKMILDANQRLSSQNVSQAQPTGASNEQTLGDGEAPAAAPAEPAPAATDAPGGIVPEPTLDANPGEGLGGDDSLGLDGALGGDEGGDLGLGGDDSLGLDGALGGEEGGDDLGLDGALGDEGADDGLGLDDTLGGDEGGDDLGLDGALGDDEGAEPGPEGGDEGGEEDSLGGDSNLDSLDDDSLDDGEGEGKEENKEEPAPAESDDDDSDEAFETDMRNATAQLESIHDQYIQDMTRAKIRTLTESYVAKQKMKHQKAQMESVSKNFDTIVDEFKETQAETNAAFESVAAEKRNELGNKVASLIEGEATRAQLESVVADYKQKTAPVMESTSDKLASLAKQYHEDEERSRFRAKLESISSAYHAQSKASKPTKKAARMESAYAAAEDPADLKAYLDKIVKNTPK